MTTVREYRRFILMENDDVDDIIVTNDDKVLTLNDIMEYGCTVNLIMRRSPPKIIRPLEADNETESESESENEMEDESTELVDYLLPEYCGSQDIKFNYGLNKS